MTKAFVSGIQLLGGAVVLCGCVFALTCLAAFIGPLARATTPSTLIVALLGLIVFAVASWRGASVFLVAPVLAALLIASTNFETVTVQFERDFARPAGQFVADFFILFLAGAIFGRVLDETGCAEAIGRCIASHIPRNAVPVAVAGLSALLVISGVAVFVVAFSIYPIAKACFAAHRLPARLIPGAIASGAFTFAMTAFPGAPSLLNIVAASGLGTSTLAEPTLGLLAGGIIAVLGSAWLFWRAASEPQSPSDTPVRTLRPVLPIHLALIPITLAFVTNLGLTVTLDWSHAPRDPGMGNAYWIAVAALATGTLAAALLGDRRAAAAGVNAGAATVVLPLLATAVCIGFGTTIDGMLVSAGPQASGDTGDLHRTIGGLLLYSALIGSSSGGLLVWLEGYGAAALAGGMNAEVLHRVSALASGVLDTLPHSAAVIGLLAICQAKHRSAYGPIFVTTVLVPAGGLMGVLLVAA